MKRVIFSIFTIINFVFIHSSLAEELVNATSVQLMEQEDGTDVYPVRMIFTDQLIRIDDNNNEGNYVIYDDSTRHIYSINHDDKTVLVITHDKWEMPVLNFDRNIRWNKIEGAPTISGKAVYQHWLAAGETICVDAQVGIDLLLSEAGLMQRYRETLAADTIKSLVATPEEMRTPCLLADQVYNKGELYSRGFPIRESHTTGLKRFMVDFKRDEKLSMKLFEVPASYKKYSMGDNLSFGQP